MDSETAVKTPTQHEQITPDDGNTTQRSEVADDRIKSENDLGSLKELPGRFKQDLTTKQKRFAQQRSILKNSQDLTLDDYELIEAKKQLIQRRRRLFSHYRQYEQWRRRQFSYDPTYYRPHGPPTGHGGHGAFHRRRQYKRQYSCAVASREDSHDSRESPSIQRYQDSMASDSVNTESTPNNQSERKSFESSECGALSYQPLHHSSRHFHMLQEEHSTSISERCTRNRINSAIFVSSEGKGFDSIEFLRRHGSQSVLCRKAKSAENITDNERKKSISNKQRWRTEESTEAINEQNDTETMETEFQEGSSPKPNETKRTLSVLNSYQQELPVSDLGYGAGRSATVTTSNIVIGSISIENPPAHLKLDILSSERLNEPQKLSFGNDFNAVLSAAHDSTDTMEELILLPTGTMSHALVHQCSSTSTNRSQSPTISPHYSPKSLNMKGVKPKISTLPMVSVSGPSPPDENRPSSGNL